MARRSDILLRGLFLFSLGVFLFLVSDALQGIRGGVVNPDPSLWGPLSPKLWIPLGCGFASGISDVYNNEWSSVLRCVALFFGLNHATVRMDFASYFQLAVTVFGLSFGLWWFFDRSRVGLGFGMTVALIATILGQSFVWRRLLRFSHPIMAAWIPCLTFCGGVTMVLVGRQLAKPDVLARSKRKID
ncbi:unnamed protein product [Echinostoma caproni]|uniref:Insulin-induced gene 1 protein n=1 Tax=Echinostoma caproni TaxID=27848 RepID=A0A183A3Z3_9TREM|nr:unnamed protein product [Echinostoma caproni]